MSEVTIAVDNTELYKNLLKGALQRGLEAVGMQCENYAAMLAPFDTGRLSASITHKMNGDDEVQVGTNVEYAAYQELGTINMAANPYLRPAAEKHKKEYGAILATFLKNG